jgi:hypothetical protein
MINHPDEPAETNGTLVPASSGPPARPAPAFEIPAGYVREYAAGEDAAPGGLLE